MPRAPIFIAALILAASGISCKDSGESGTVVVHVLRDPYFGADLVQVNAQFARTNPRLHSGRAVSIETKDDVP